MKKILFILVPVSILFACNSGHNPERAPELAKTEDSISFSPEQLEKIKRIHSVFSEVYPISMKETIENFKHDQNPDSEIITWTNMADAYENYLAGKQKKPDLNTKKEIFALILSRSMMPDTQAIDSTGLKILSKEEAMQVLSFYKAPPDPVDEIK
jgi:hypothetical protein